MLPFLRNRMQFNHAAVMGGGGAALPAFSEWQALLSTFDWNDGTANDFAHGNTDGTVGYSADAPYPALWSNFVGGNQDLVQWYDAVESGVTWLPRNGPPTIKISEESMIFAAAATNDLVSTGTFTNLPDATQSTFYVLFRLQTLGIAHTIFDHGRFSAGTGGSIQFIVDSANRPEVLVYDNTGVLRNGKRSTAITSGTWYLATIRINTAHALIVEQVHLLIDNVAAVTHLGFQDLASANINVDREVVLGANYDGAMTHFDGALRMFGWRGVLDESYDNEVWNYVQYLQSVSP